MKKGMVSLCVFQAGCLPSEDPGREMKKRKVAFSGSESDRLVN
jgi:hypothetical protein